MNVEGVAGKNPVYHVGKLYNLAAQALAERLSDESGSYVEVHLISATGQRLDRPWRVLVRTASGDIEPQFVRQAVIDAMDNPASLTARLLETRVLE